MRRATCGPNEEETWPEPNTLFGGSPNETISERAAKARNAGRWWGCMLCRALDRFKRGHCDDALTSTIGGDAVIPDGE
ncbi:hypothetical protein WS62_21400 [Burkholderia sp. ABCPW 14]|nr:hypothetical protein WS62_21400 [Burkholderia sp. ABCPW 14]